MAKATRAVEFTPITLLIENKEELTVLKHALQEYRTKYSRAMPNTEALIRELDKFS